MLRLRYLKPDKCVFFKLLLMLHYRALRCDYFEYISSVTSRVGGLGGWVVGVVFMGLFRECPGEFVALLRSG